jgi:NADH:ubiquinone oxidoreductase subunit 3 (subunit A)
MIDLHILLSLPITVTIFALVAYGLHRLGGKIAAKGEATEGKHMPYTGGEAHIPMPSRLSYHRFFKLALVFSILHVAALVLSTLPRQGASRQTALIYLVGIAISVFALIERDE